MKVQQLRYSDYYTALSYHKAPKYLLATAFCCYYHLQSIIGTQILHFYSQGNWRLKKYVTCPNHRRGNRSPGFLKVNQYSFTYTMLSLHSLPVDEKYFGIFYIFRISLACGWHLAGHFWRLIVIFGTLCWEGFWACFRSQCERALWGSKDVCCGHQMGDRSFCAIPMNVPCFQNGLGLALT